MRRRVASTVVVLVATVVVTAVVAPAAAGSARVEAPADDPGGATGSGAPTAAISPDDPSTTGDVPLRDGGSFYVGQVLTTEAYDPGDDVRLRRADGAFVTTVFVRADGSLRVATDGRAAGSYTLESPDGPTLSFTLIQQTLGLRIDGGPVQPPGAAATLNVDTNRPSSVVYLTATREGEDVETAALHSVVGEGTRVDLNDDGSEDAVRLTGVGDGDAVALNFSGRSPGNYSLQTTVRDTSVTASATVAVTPTGNGTASFPVRVITGGAGDVIAIPVELTNTASARLVLGSDDLKYNVSLRLHDDDGDDTVTVRWDTSLAGAGATEDDAFAAAGTDSVSNVDRRTGRIGGSLATEPYPLSLRVDGREFDVGTVVLRASQSPAATETAARPDGRSASILSGRVCDRDASTLIETYDTTVDAVPGVAAGTVTDETIHLVVTDGRDYTAVTGSDRRITAFRRGAPDSPTLEVETDCETVRTVVDAPNTTDAFADEYRSGEITVRGRTLPKQIALGVIETIDRIGRALGLF
ncbi:MAG: hypothetical protein V5A31_13345 [Haloferacaceae archaeon]